jgi:hypothetical protein
MLKDGARLNLFCGWGDGPDVGINYSDGRVDIMVPIDLTADEALELAFELTRYAQTAKKLDQELKEHNEHLHHS